MGLTPSSVAVLSVLFGLGTVLILYRLARNVFDERVALAAATILAVSTYHVFYSASQIPAMMATFFLLLGIYFYLVAASTGSPRRFVLAGVTIAYAFGCHFNLLLFVLAIFGFQALLVGVLSVGPGIRHRTLPQPHAGFRRVLRCGPVGVRMGRFCPPGPR